MSVSGLSCRTGRSLLAVFLSLYPALLGISDCSAPDQDQDGYSTEEGDCDDGDPEVHPSAAEVCDGSDNNCDGLVDESQGGGLYPDEDGDGFGRDDGSSCASGGEVEARGDCDDQDPAVHPGAPDSAGDGQDGDCGGTDAPEPHVGLSPDSLSSIEGALAQAAEGTTVWVGPGTWLEFDLSFAGRAVTLASTHLARKTVVDAGGLGRGFLFVDGESAETVLDGFTIQGGVAVDHGAGVYIRDASPTLRGCVVTGNRIEAEGGKGGGIYLEGSKARIEECRIAENTLGGVCSTTTSSGPSSNKTTTTCTEGRGGGLYVTGSSPLIRRATIVGNRTRGDGAGLFVTGSSLRLEATELSGNVAAGACTSTYEKGTGYNDYYFREDYVCKAAGGGGLYATGSTLELHGNHFRDNTALTPCEVVSGDSGYGGWEDLKCGRNEGGGASIRDSSAVFDADLFTGSSARSGAGLYLNGGTVQLRGGRIEDNHAVMACARTSDRDDVGERTTDECQGGLGGGLYLEGGAPAIEQAAVVGNLADGSGGGLYLVRSSPVLTGASIRENEAAGRQVLESICFEGISEYRDLRLHEGFGGGLHADGSSPTMEHVEVAGNRAPKGAGLSLRGSPASLAQVSITGQKGPTWEEWDLECGPCGSQSCTGTTVTRGGTGAALYVDASSPTIVQAVIAGNEGETCSSTDTMPCLEAYSGIYLTGSSSQPAIGRSILAYNAPYNLYRAGAEPGSLPGLTWSDLYNPSGVASHNLSGLEPSVLTVEPGFLRYDGAGRPEDLHLAGSSRLCDAGDPALSDADGSRSDPGLYGGPAGAGWDRDGDGWYDYFWPGTLEDAPAGFDPAEWDCDDKDPSRQQCE